MSSSTYGAIDNGSGKKLTAVVEEMPLIAKIKGVIVSPSSSSDENNNGASSKKGGHTILHYIVYAIINVIIALPALYGFSSVIFNHPIFQPHVAALSKLVIFSSFMHQLGFVLFLGLDFAIGTVQDAGLIFLSAMANNIAESILEKGGSVEEVISTTLVILSLGTASLGAVLALLGKYQLLDIVSYLPMPVIGGYLAFIGYFCLMAGVALCIGEAMTETKDWVYLFHPKAILLAIPGLLAGLVFVMISKKATNDAVLPLTMILIPTAFYIVLFVSGTSLQEARDFGWVGKDVPPVLVQDLFHLIDFKLVHWDEIGSCFGIWVGMLFVVSFASCLDVAAIAMDMGEALDTNKEMVTVGISNVMSGLTGGFTGSYIFSQTIFTYRTGCHSRLIGMFIMVLYLGVVLSSINVLEISPLFFLGATLIFIGYDLLWEWLVEIRSKVFLMDYAIIWTTFIAIQIIGMDFGILLGVVVALVEHVASTTRVSSIMRVMKRSRTVWSKEDYNILSKEGYDAMTPKIITLELKGSVFFGSSAKLLKDLIDEIGLKISEEDMKEIVESALSASPAYISVHGKRPKMTKQVSRILPQFVVLDFTEMHSLDASASTSCFQQLAKMCEKRGILLCGSGAIPRVDWMLRTHKVAYGNDAEIDVKNELLSDQVSNLKHGKIILFTTVHEALEFSERLLIETVTSKMPNSRHSLLLRDWASSQSQVDHQVQLTTVLTAMCELGAEEVTLVESIHPYYHAAKYQSGENIFMKNSQPDAFYIVLQGFVAVPEERKGNANHQRMLSGAGALVGSVSSNFTEGHYHKLGGIFGYCDYLLERYRSFEAHATGTDGAMVAVFSRTNVDKMKDENYPLYLIVQRLLLRASLNDLANCTCHN